MGRGPFHDTNPVVSHRAAVTPHPGRAWAFTTWTSPLMWRHLLDIMRTMFMFKTLMAIGAIVALGDQGATVTATLTLHVCWRWVEGPRNLNRFRSSQMLKALQKYHPQ